jgi:hypothetical protein
MYATLSYDAGWTAANVIDDVKDVLTGETVKTNLSASINQTETEIVSTVAAGWTLHDTVTAGADYILRAPLVDDGATFKHLQITLSGDTIIMSGWEGWDAGTNTGTNQATANDVADKYVNGAGTTTPCKVLIHASARHVAFKSIMGATLNTTTGTTMLFEYGRVDLWNTVANGYPNFAVSNFESTSNIYLGSSSGEPPFYNPRSFNRASGADNTGTTISNATSLGYLTPWGSTYYGAPQTLGNWLGGNAAYKVYDANKTLQHGLIPWGVTDFYSGTGITGVFVSDVIDIWFTTSSLGNCGDEITYNSNEYVLWGVLAVVDANLQNGAVVMALRKA